jgi:hypothetical protein
VDSIATLVEMNKLVPFRARGAFNQSDYNAAANNALKLLDDFAGYSPKLQKVELLKMQQQQMANDIIVQLVTDITMGNVRMNRVLATSKKFKCAQAVMKIMMAGVARTKLATTMSELQASGGQVAEWANGLTDILHQRLKEKNPRHPLLSNADCDHVVQSLTGMHCHTYI